MIEFMFTTPIGKHGRLANKEMSQASDSSSSGGGCMKNKSETPHSQTRAQQTLATYFRYSLIELLKITLNGAPHFIRYNFYFYSLPSSCFPDGSTSH